MGQQSGLGRLSPINYQLVPDFATIHCFLLEKHPLSLMTLDI
jgi:hypothetical protein